MSTLTDLILDCETIPNEALLARAGLAMPAPIASDAPKTHSKPETIAKWLFDAQTNHIEKVRRRMSTDPILGRVICISTITSNVFDDTYMEETGWVLKSEPIATEEKRILEDFWARVATADRFITFNGTNFDIPFLTKRSRMLGVTPIPILPEHHIDLMRETSTRTYNGGYDNKSLDELRAWFGISRATDHTGADVYPDYLADNMMTIGRHCLDDVQATYRIAKEIGLL